MTRIITLVLISVYALPSFANTTFYDVLKSNFNSSREAINYEDFDRVADPEARVCTEISSETPYDEKLVHIHKYVQLREPAGPVLPPVTFTLVAFSEYGQISFPRHDLPFMNTSIVDRGREVLTTYQRPDQYNWRLRVRKSGDYLFFNRSGVSRYTGTDEERQEVSVDVYGYCFHLE